MNDSTRVRLTGPLLVFVSFATLLAFRESIVAATISPGQTHYALALSRAIAIGFWLAAAGLTSRVASVFLFDGLLARSLGAPVPRLLKDVSSFFVYAAAITLIAALVFELPLTGFWATSSVVGLILGFALRNIILDVFTGLAVNVDRPYRLGDWIEIHGSPGSDKLIGRVAEINWRTTRVETEAGSTVVVPNSMFSTMVVTNFWSPTDATRLDCEVTLDSSVPVERARRVLQAAARTAMAGEGFVRDREPRVLIGGTSEAGIVYKVRYWIHAFRELSPSAANDKVMSHVLHHLDRAGLALGIPKEDVYVATMPARQLDWKSLEGRRALVAKVPLFEPLQPTELAALADGMKERFVRSGDTLIRRGTSGDSMFIVAEGLLDVYSTGDHNGHDVLLGHVGPGEFLGEMSLLTGEPRSATVVAATDVVTYEVTKHQLDPLINDRPNLAETIGHVVAERHVREQRALDEDAAESEPAAVTNIAQQIVRRMRQFLRAA